MLINDETPLEPYTVDNRVIYVKREDMACNPPGPPFAKVRGLYPKLVQLKQQGIQTVGYTDTTISMGGWGVAYFAKELGLNCYVFYPQHSPLRHNLPKHLPLWEELGAIPVPLLPSRLSIMQLRAKKIFRTNNTKLDRHYMLPNGLPFKETVEEVSRVYVSAALTNKHIFNNATIVVAVGSGIMLSGIIKGVLIANARCGIKPHVIKSVLVSKKDPSGIRSKILLNSGHPAHNSPYSLFNPDIPMQHVIDDGYEYEQEVDNSQIPFPCNRYYDAKAWAWLRKNLWQLNDPVIFWNLGADGVI